MERIKSKIIRQKRAILRAGYSRKNTIISFMLVFLCVFASHAATQATYYVATTGSDTTGDGSVSNPWATISKAKTVIAGISRPLTGDIIVKIASGDYFLSSTEVFDTNDSGTASGNCKVIYQNKDAVGSARFIGGSYVTGWSLHSGNIYKAYVGTGLTINNIYENEIHRGRPARYPNYQDSASFPGSEGSYLIAKSGDTAEGEFVRYFKNNIRPFYTAFSWPDSAQIAIWNVGGSADWNITRIPISDIDSYTRDIYFSSASSPDWGYQDRYFIEGLYELLDAPGEFYYDEPNGYLYYWPVDGTPDNDSIILPKIHMLFKALGSFPSTPVHRITFDGLSFYNTTVGEDYNFAAVYLEYTNNIEIKNCHFKNLGGKAITMFNANEYNTVQGCWIEHIGRGGVLLQNNKSRTTYPDAKSQYNVITNCMLQNYTGAGITLQNTSDCEVSYCEIFNGGRYATSCRGNRYYTTLYGTHYSKNNVFKYLKVYNCGTDSGDMGVVHAAAIGAHGIPGVEDENNVNYWEQITIDSISADPSMQDFSPNGIFLDWPHSTENQSFKNIEITNTQGDQFRTNNNPVQTLDNVSWESGFDNSLMNYSNIGLTASFPAVYGTSTTPVPSPETGSLPGEIIVDDSTTGKYLERGTGWCDSGLTGKIGNCRYNAGTDSTASAVWTPEIPVSGMYDVYVWKLASVSSAKKEARYTVNFNGGSVTHRVNQTINPSRWVKLGSYYFEAGSSGNVVLSMKGDGNVRADSIRFVPVWTMDMVAHWKFGDVIGGTEAKDSTGNGLDGIVYGAAFNASGKIGQCLDLDGVDDRVTVYHDNRLNIGTGDFAVSMWFKRTSSSVGNARLIAKGAGYSTQEGYCIWGSNTTIYSSISDGTSRISASASYSGLDTWHHLVVNFDRDGDMQLYIDGVAGTPVSIASFNGDDISNSLHMTIGSYVSSLYWKGAVDDIRLFARVLSEEEINHLGSPEQLPEIPSDVKGHWNMDESSGSIVGDSSGYGLDGTIYGATYNTSGINGGCRTFDGSDDYISVTDNDNLDMGTGDFAISIWFTRHPNTTTNLRLLYKGAQANDDPGYCIMGSNSVINVVLCNGATRIYAESAIVLRDWNHVVVNFDRTNGLMKVYLNGCLQSSGDISSFNGDDISNNKSLSIGCGDGGLYWDGEIDEVRIYKKALTDDEIAGLYDSVYYSNE